MSKLQSAVQYARSGYSVLPMNGKCPLIRFANQSALTVDQVKEYWSRWPHANIALRTTSFFVVDIDTKQAHGQDGMKSIRQLPKGTILPTRTQRTSSGGYQMFYMKPHNDNSLTQVIGILPGVDIKANPNNYVLVPPSTTVKGQYRWINSATAPIKKPSALLLRMIYNHHSQSVARANIPRYRAGKRWTGIVLDNLVKGVSKGQRNDYLARVCGQLVHAGVKAETILELLNFTNQHNTPPLAKKEVQKIVISILKEEVK